MPKACIWSLMTHVAFHAVAEKTVYSLREKIADTPPIQR
jgi:hypothetical protein